MNPTLRRAVAEEDARWGEALAAAGVSREAMRQRHHDKGRSEAFHKGAPCVAVWPADPLPEAIAEPMLSVLGALLMEEDRRTCWCGNGGGMPITLMGHPRSICCSFCLRDTDWWFDYSCCDACQTETEELFFVMAYAGPCTVLAWLCWECSECEPC